MKLPQSFVILQQKFTPLIKVALVDLKRVKAKKEYQIKQSDSVITVNIFFAKNEENIQKHLSICAAKEGITYSFDNSQIIDYQDNFKYMGSVPFSV